MRRIHWNHAGFPIHIFSDYPSLGNHEILLVYYCCYCKQILSSLDLENDYHYLFIMIQATLSCEKFITTLFDSMEANGWKGFDKWPCFRCGSSFGLYKYVGYDRNTLMLVDSTCDHPACSYCNKCYSWLLGPAGVTDFAQFNMLRLDYQCISLVQHVGNLVIQEERKKCNKCFIFNMLVCFARAKIYKHVFDATGAAFNLGIGVTCTLQGLFDTIGYWSRGDFVKLARDLDRAGDAAATLRVFQQLFKFIGDQ